MTYIAPKRGLKAFTCPFCGVLARQHHKASTPELDGNYGCRPDMPIATSICEHCEEFAVWVGEKMVHPDRGNAPPPNSAMPDDVRNCYEEAASIFSRSPRGAAAILRLAVQMLCKALGERGGNVNADIAALVKKGLPPRVQQSLDLVRVVGNNAVHPGQIDVDDPAVAERLFALINVTVEYMIALPEQVEGLYGQLPADSRSAIDKRDATNSSSK